MRFVLMNSYQAQLFLKHFPNHSWHVLPLLSTLGNSCLMASTIHLQLRVYHKDWKVQPLLIPYKEQDLIEVLKLQLLKVQTDNTHLHSQIRCYLQIGVVSIRET